MRFAVRALVLGTLLFAGCEKNDDGENGGDETASEAATGSVVIYNKYSTSTYSGVNGDIQRILISNDDFFQTYYYDIKKGANKTISNIPEGTYDVEAQVKTSSLYRSAKKSGIKVKKGQTASVTFQ